MGYPRIIAHRCGGALAPENTLAGLRLAARLGCRGVEFDAMLAADGVPVLIHDETLERTTSGQGRVADMDSARLIRLDAGIRHHAAFAVEPVPTLDAALQLCAALGLWANVEIKPAVGHEAATGRVVARHAAAGGGRLVLSSFSETALRAAAAEAPQLPRALLVEVIPADWRERLAGLGAMALHCSARGLTAGVAAAVRAEGFPLACYTINRRDEAERLFAMGVSAVFSDRPDLWALEEM
ncbi:glycerophosphodiester phosphodiesterase [Sulfuritalea hydrogenivorans]|uniref:Cytoplasmic glycerophosphodiester phosphodiesterase n=1 Tax=Sulfuritalea hydrogenivorans sk43H TaxID=1223802 RepID=W0SFV4_9PROT|nr:glycerophosphodiester phosphodiesterase [Sulfuritalea hydrogenivorans]BAO28608.1 cytoplasmic glycerophosphodiester phosphodiesterase [Sulfuritalea hydrogenivorans sk43H]